MSDDEEDDGLDEIPTGGELAQIALMDLFGAFTRLPLHPDTKIILQSEQAVLWKMAAAIGVDFKSRRYIPGADAWDDEDAWGAYMHALKRVWAKIGHHGLTEFSPSKSSASSRALSSIAKRRLGNG